jgi:hypothetical protein
MNEKNKGNREKERKTSSENDMRNDGSGKRRLKGRERGGGGDHKQNIASFNQFIYETPCKNAH